MYYRATTAVYGSASSPKHWSNTVAEYRLAAGFVRGDNDRTVHHHGDLYVTHLSDRLTNFLFDGPETGVCKFVSDLRARFDTNDPQYLAVGSPIDFCGMIVATDGESIFLFMEPYIRQCVKVMGFPVPKRAPATPSPREIIGGEPLSAKDIVITISDRHWFHRVGGSRISYRSHTCVFSS